MFAVSGWADPRQIHQLLKKQNDLRDAACLSRTWTALANLLRQGRRNDEAQRFEAQRTELWNHWQGKLPNAHFLLSQSLTQITPPPAFLRAANE